VLKIERRILRLLRRNPDGISMAEIRVALRLKPGEQEHLSRRLRGLDEVFEIERRRSGRAVSYVLHGKRQVSVDRTPVDRATRARILYRDGGRCQMCGRSVADGVRLQVDHRVPRDWGGPTEDWNLWALCEDCNQGKKAFFATSADPRLRRAMRHRSVHVRIGELLKARAGEPVPKELLAIAAYGYDDWEKRMRELRELGWRFHPVRKRDGGKVKIAWVLDHSEPWPDDPATAIRRSERMRRRDKH
jgi:hypothetical protein